MLTAVEANSEAESQAPEGDQRENTPVLCETQNADWAHIPH